MTIRMERWKYSESRTEEPVKSKNKRTIRQETEVGTVKRVLHLQLTVCLLAGVPGRMRRGESGSSLPDTLYVSED